MFLSEKIRIIQRQTLSDSRGWFLKVINGEENIASTQDCEVYVTSASPHQSRGGHYHLRTNEWFTLIKGTAILRLQDINTHETLSIPLEAVNPVTVYVPCGVAHIFENVSATEDFVLIAYADTLYDPSDTIMYSL